MGAAKGAKAERRGQSTCGRDFLVRVRVKVRFKEQEAEVYAFVQQSSIEIERDRADRDTEDAWPSVWGATVQFRG